MEGCFMFQWRGGVCFSDGGGLIFKWGVPMGGISFGGGGGVGKKPKRRGAPPPMSPNMGNPAPTV